jgi:hypothetical protein
LIASDEFHRHFFRKPKVCRIERKGIPIMRKRRIQIGLLFGDLTHNKLSEYQTIPVMNIVTRLEF